MSCTAHLFGIRYDQHHWHRSFVDSETARLTEHDMWGRAIESQHVVCHTRMVCAHCGEKGAFVECICDKQKADCCAFRLEGLNRLSEARV